MRLNIDCVRDIVLCVESLVTPTKYAVFLDTDLLEQNKSNYLRESEIPKTPTYQIQLLDKYNNEELIYHLNYCLKADLLELATNQYQDGIHIAIQDLTPKGHEFISNIRNDTIFEKTKEISKKIGVKTLSSFIKISESVTTEIIKQYFT